MFFFFETNFCFIFNSILVSLQSNRVLYGILLHGFWFHPHLTHTHLPTHSTAISTLTFPPVSLFISHTLPPTCLKAHSMALSSFLATNPRPKYTYYRIFISFCFSLQFIWKTFTTSFPVYTIFSLVHLLPLTIHFVSTLFSFIILYPLTYQFPCCSYFAPHFSILPPPPFYILTINHDGFKTPVNYIFLSPFPGSAIPETSLGSK